MPVNEGLNIKLQSDIPIGCGMGSSAAALISLITALIAYFKLEIESEKLLQLAKEVENFQHGYSSGLDLIMSLYGGCVYVQNGQHYPRVVPPLSFYLVNTGVPSCSTGECVAAATPYFKTSTIGNDFASITTALDKALQAGQTNIAELIHENHSLLVKIGVVPNRVQAFINTVQKIGGVAKVCGAGAIVGDAAGIVLVCIEDESALQALCQIYQYSLLEVSMEERGVYVI